MFRLETDKSPGPNKLCSGNGLRAESLRRAHFATLQWRAGADGSVGSGKNPNPASRRRLTLSGGSELAIAASFLRRGTLLWENACARSFVEKLENATAKSQSSAPSASLSVCSGATVQTDSRAASVVPSAGANCRDLSRRGAKSIADTPEADRTIASLAQASPLVGAQERA